MDRKKLLLLFIVIIIIISGFVYSKNQKYPKAVISFTYDDGFQEDNLTYNIFDEYGYKCSFSLISDKLDGYMKNNIDNYIEYERNGFEVLSHSSNHIKMNEDIAKNILKYEVYSSKKKLEQTGFDIKGFVVPYSTMKKDYVPFTLKYYDYILVGGDGLNYMKNIENRVINRTSLYANSLDDIKNIIDNAIEKNSLVVFYDHRTGNGGSSSEEKLRLILEYTRSKDDEVKVLPISSGIEYYSNNYKDILNDI